jgi:amino acid transporter
MSNNIDTNLEKRFGYEQSLNRVLPLSSLVFFGLAYLAPTAIFTMYGIVTEMTHGMMTLAMIFASIAMLFTAVSYQKMSSVYPIAGSAYSYSSRSIHPNAGFLTGWALLLDYILLPMIVYLLAALYLGVYFPGVPSWVFIVAIVVFTTVINCLGVKLTAGTNNFMVIIQFVFIFAFAIFAIKWLTTGDASASLFDSAAIFNSTEFNSPEVGWSAILGGTAILAFVFLGFDAVTTVAEEAINPEKNIGKAIILTCLIGGTLFIALSYLMQASWPTGWNEFESVDTAAVEAIEKIAGSTMAYLFTAVYVVSCIAGSLAQQAAAARLLFGMGRDGVLPKKFFGYVHPKYKTPFFDIILIGALGLLAIFVDLFSLASVINFGALAAFMMVNLSVISHFFIKEKRRNTAKDVVNYLVLPLMGFAVCGAIWLSLDSSALLLGFGWLAIGGFYLLFLRKVLKVSNIELDFSDTEGSIK